MINEELSYIPGVGELLLKLVCKRASFDPLSPFNISLPDDTFSFKSAKVDESIYQRYHKVTGWDYGSEMIHPCYLHSFVFPLHLKLLLLPKSPFPLLGLVHMSNQIRQFRPINKGDRLAIFSRFGELKLHPKGWLFAIKVDIYCGSELAWQSTSHYLFRYKHGRFVERVSEQATDAVTEIFAKTVELNATLGWRYAKVSNDFNPIHLSKWLARVFGFKQHIAHGMWTKSYCISELMNIKPFLLRQAFEVNASFWQPLYLPSQMNMAFYSMGIGVDMFQFKGMGSETEHKQAPLHIVGNIRVI